MSATYLGLRTLGYKVPDLQKAKEWYTKVFNIEPYFDEPFYVGFNIAGFELGLQPVENEQPIPGTSSTTYWGVEDVDKEYTRLLELGATPYEKPTDVGGDIVVATVKDPWGNLFGIIYNPHFKL